MNKLADRVSTVTWWGSFTGSRRDYLAHYANIDPFRVIREKAACGTLVTLSKCLPESVLRHDEWYNDFVLKGGVRDILGTKLYENASHMVIVGFHRAIGDRHPVAGDAEALQLLMAPLRSAARLHAGLISLGFRSAIARRRLDHLGAGVVFTTGSGRIIEANPPGEAILRAGDGVTVSDGRISARRSFETTKLAHLIANATNASVSDLSGGCMLVARVGGRSPYVVRVAPVGARSAGYNIPAAMVVISAADENLVSEPEIADLYGLSPAESRLAVALAQGRKLTDLVSEFGVQLTTLRTQLSSVLNKCGVERQVDLVRLISNIPIVRLTPSEKGLM